MRKADTHEQATFGGTNRKIVVVLNGPPGIGKDTLAELMEIHNYSHGSFKEGLYAATAEHYNVPLDVVKALCTNRVTKENPTPTFSNKTPRKALQYVSEEVMKPVWGQAYFGNLLAKTCENTGGDFVISDGGFPEEIEPLLEVFDTVYICRLWREGFSFEGDTRRYLYSTMQDLGREGIVFFDIKLADDKPEAGAATIELAIKLEEGL